MTYRKSLLYFFLLGWMFTVSLGISSHPGVLDFFSNHKQESVPRSVQNKFRDLMTNLNKRKIDISLVLEGGPGKDGIPAIHEPKFVKVKKANLKEDILGIFVDIDGEQRYYPYNILVWHEIVNDSIGNTHFVVTFCPLCGSGIVLNRSVEGEVLRFGVSGLLFESNLLMYDHKTESLWSQSRGEAVVGDYTGTTLELIQMQVIPFKELIAKYLKASVLSEDTGHTRDYSLYPYGDYETNDNLYFPVSVMDKRFPAKEMMYVFRLGEKVVAFPVKSLRSKDRSKVIEGQTVNARREGYEIHVTVDGQTIPGYYEMWFSWAVHHQKNGIVWTFDK
jgi:hypothetical protein